MNTLSQDKPDPHAKLRMALRYATTPGRWTLVDPLGELHVGIEGESRKLIWGGADPSGRTPLQGYNDLFYAVAAANAVPALLKEREQLRLELTRLHSLANLSQGGMGDEPMTSMELASRVCSDVKAILEKLGGFAY